MTLISCVCYDLTFVICWCADNPCMITWLAWSMNYEMFIERNRNGWTNDDICMGTPPPSSLKAPPSTTGGSPFPSPAATLASWGQSPISTPVRSPAPSMSAPSQTSHHPSPAQALSVSALYQRTYSPSPSPTPSRSTTLSLSVTPSSQRAVLQPIQYTENALTSSQVTKGHHADMATSGGATHHLNQR